MGFSVLDVKIVEDGRVVLCNGVCFRLLVKYMIEEYEDEVVFVWGISEGFFD